MNNTDPPVARDERREIIRLAEEVLGSDWDDVHLATEHWELTLRRRDGAPASGVAAPAPPAPVEPPAPAPALPTAPALATRPPAPSGPTIATGDGPTIDAPMSGTFYRCPAPGAPPFVEEGDTVVARQTVAIIEVMKLMYEIKADQRATVQQVLAADGQAVGKGQALISVEPLPGG